MCVCVTKYYMGLWGECDKRAVEWQMQFAGVCDRTSESGMCVVSKFAGTLHATNIIRFTATRALCLQSQIIRHYRHSACVLFRFAAAANKRS